MINVLSIWSDLEFLSSSVVDICSNFSCWRPPSNLKKLHLTIFLSTLQVSALFSKYFWLFSKFICSNINSSHSGHWSILYQPTSFSKVLLGWRNLRVSSFTGWDLMISWNTWRLFCHKEKYFESVKKSTSVESPPRSLAVTSTACTCSQSLRNRIKPTNLRRNDFSPLSKNVVQTLPHLLLSPWSPEYEPMKILQQTNALSRQITKTWLTYLSTVALLKLILHFRPWPRWSWTCRSCLSESRKIFSKKVFVSSGIKSPFVLDIVLPISVSLKSHWTV